MSGNAKAILIGFGGSILLLVLIWFMIAPSSGDEDKVYECSSCGKEFTNSDDTHSIAMTSMCEPCYADFKYIRELYEEAEKYRERNR